MEQNSNNCPSPSTDCFLAYLFSCIKTTMAQRQNPKLPSIPENDNLGFDAQAVKVPAQPKLTRQVAYSANAVEYSEEDLHYVSLIETAHKILRKRINKKLEELERQSNGADEHGLRPFFKDLLTYEQGYLRSFLLPYFRDEIKSRNGQEYPCEMNHLLNTWNQSDEALKVCQSYMFLLKDFHAVTAPANKPFLHFIDDALSFRYQQNKNKQPRPNQEYSENEKALKRTRFVTKTEEEKI
jgi:hypothetical protein